MFCKNCGFEIKNPNVKFCPQCGSILDNVASQQETMQQSVQEPVIEETAPITDTVTPQFPSMGEEPLPKKAPKKKKNKAPLCIGLAAIAVALVVAIVFNWAFLENFFKKTFSSDEDYFKYVNSKSTDQFAEGIASLLSADAELAELKAKGAVSFQLGDEALALLESSSGQSFDWLSNGEIALNTSVQDNVMGSQMIAKLDGKEAMTMEVISDMETQKMYIRIPELSQQYLCADMNSLNNMGSASGYYDDEYYYDDDEYYYGDNYYSGSSMAFGGATNTEAYEVIDKIMETLPDEKTTAEMIKRYLDVVYDNLGDIEKEEDTVKVNGVSQKGTKYTAEIDEDTIVDVTEAFLEEVRDDEEIERIIKDVADIEELDVSQDPDTVYDEFLDSIDYALESLDADRLNFDETITFSIWVDGSGNVFGREVDCDAFTISWLEPQHGKQRALEISITADGQSISFEGIGTVSGDKTTGEYTLEVMGMDILEIEVEDFTMEKGVSGTVIIAPASGLSSIMGSADSMAGSLLTDLKVQLDFANTEEKADTKITILTEGEMFVSVGMTGEASSDFEARIPADSEVIDMTDSAAMQNWQANADIAGFISKLRDAGVPEELLSGMFPS